MQAGLGSSMKAQAASGLQPQTVPLALLVATFRAHLLEFAPLDEAGLWARGYRQEAIGRKLGEWERKGLEILLCGRKPKIWL